MKKLQFLIVTILSSVLITGCEPQELFERQNPEDYNEVISTNTQWLIDNSPFYMVRGFDNKYSALKNDTRYGYPNALEYRFDDGTRIDSYLMSISFVDSATFEIRECRFGELFIETGNYHLRLSYNPNDLEQIVHDSFLSIILSFDLPSNTIFTEEVMRLKEQEENKINNMDDILQPFKIGGEENTYEINVERNFSSALFYGRAIFNLNQYFNYDPDFPIVAIYTDLSIIQERTIEEWKPRFSYLDQWGYWRLIESTGIFFETMISVNNSAFFEVFGDSLATDFSCLHGEIPIDDCDIPCENGTVVEGVEGDCFCQCEEGWTGPACDQPITVVLQPELTLMAGDGTSGFTDGIFGQISNPGAVAYSQTDSRIYFTNIRSIRSVDPNTHDVQTLVPNNPQGYVDGAFNQARFGSLGDIVVDDQGRIYVADPVNNAIRMIANGEVSTYAGNGTAGFMDGLAANAQFNYPYGLAIKDDTLFVADQLNGRIRAITMSDTPTERNVITYAGSGSFGNIDGPNNQAGFNGPYDLDYDEFNKRFIVIDNGAFGKDIRSVTASQTSTLTTSIPGNSILLNPVGVTCDIDGSFYLSDRGAHVVYRMRDMGGVYAGQGVAGQYQNAGFNGGPFGTSQLNLPNLMTFAPVYIEEENRTRQSLIITSTLAHSIWYIPVR